MIKSLSIVLYFLTLVCFAQNKPTLKDAFKDDFLIGAALGSEHILEKTKKPMI
jgi:hypothetical protein